MSSTNDEALDELEPVKSEPKKSTRKPAAKKKEVELNAQEKKELDRKVEDAVDEVLEKKNKVNEGLEHYKQNGGRRWRCKVESTRSGVQHFEMIIADPSNPSRPVPIRGRCGVIIEEGLPQFAIDRLKESYRMETTDVPANPNATAGLDTRAIKVPNYTVEIFNEVQNPKPIGTVK